MTIDIRLDDLAAIDVTTLGCIGAAAAARVLLVGQNPRSLEIAMLRGPEPDGQGENNSD